MSWKLLACVVKPEDADVCLGYVNPMFLIEKPGGGSLLVIAFMDVGRCSNPQPPLMACVWSPFSTPLWVVHISSYLTCLSSVFQIPVAKYSIKYCRIVTPFHGIRVYAQSSRLHWRSRCRILGDFFGSVAIIADDLFCGADSPEELLKVWSTVLHILDKYNFRLSATKLLSADNPPLS